MAWVQIYGGTPVSGGSQNLTPTRYANSNSFGTAVVTRGAVNLSPTLLFDATIGLRWGADDLYWSSQGFAWGSGDTFQSHTVTATYALTATRYTNSSTFGTPVVTRGAVTLSPTRYTDADSFGAHTVANVGGATQNLTATRYADPDTFGTPVVTRGAVALTPTRYTNTSTFGAATVTRGAVSLAPARYTDPDTFGAAVVTQGALLQATRYANSNTFGAAVVTVGAAPAAETNNLHPLGPVRFRCPQYVLRIAGRRVVVDDEDEFKRLIDEFEGVAQKRAVVKARAVAASAPKAAPERVAKTAPKVEISAANEAAKADVARLKAQVDAVNAQIAQMYESALRSELIRAYMAEQDDEEAVLAALF